MLLDAGAVDHFRPFLDVGAQLRVRFGGRTGLGIDAEVEKTVLHVRIGEHLVQRLVERRDDIRRSSGLRIKRIPGRRRKSFHTLLARGLDVRERG